MGLMVLVLHLCSLRTFGVPYMSPLSPFIREEMKDSIFRFPIPSMIFRPRDISKENLVRQGKDGPQKPRKKQ